MFVSSRTHSMRVSYESFFLYTILAFACMWSQRDRVLLQRVRVIVCTKLYASMRNLCSCFVWAIRLTV